MSELKNWTRQDTRRTDRVLAAELKLGRGGIYNDHINAIAARLTIHQACDIVRRAKPDYYPHKKNGLYPKWPRKMMEERDSYYVEQCYGFNPVRTITKLDLHAVSLDLTPSIFPGVEAPTVVTGEPEFTVPESDGYAKMTVARLRAEIEERYGNIKPASYNSKTRKPDLIRMLEEWDDDHKGDAAVR